MSRADLDAIQNKLKAAIQGHQMLVAKLKSDPQNSNLKQQLHAFQVQITTLSQKQRLIVDKLRKELLSRQNKTVPGQGKTQAVEGEKTKQLLNIGRKPPSPKKPEKKATVEVPQLSPQTPPIKVPQYTRPSILQGRRSSLFGGSARISPPTVAPPSINVVSKAINSEIVRKSVEDIHLSPGDKKKLKYMAILDLVTPVTLKELQNKRTERRRRSTANPRFKYSRADIENKRIGPSCAILCKNVIPLIKRGRGRPPKSPGSSRPQSPVIPPLPNSSNDSMQNDGHDDFCAVCRKSGELLMCDTCSLVFHLTCLTPPLHHIPIGDWSCSKCEEEQKARLGIMKTSSLAEVQSFAEAKAIREEERRQELTRQMDIERQQSELDEKHTQVQQALEQKTQEKADLLLMTKNAQKSVDKLKGFINIFVDSTR